VNKKVLILILAILLGQNLSFAEYVFNRVRPIEYPSNWLMENRYISHNYGEYRSPTYFHDGMDYQAGDISVSIKR
jgi:hypothetical protein